MRPGTTIAAIGDSSRSILLGVEAGMGHIADAQREAAHLTADAQWEGARMTAAVKRVELQVACLTPFVLYFAVGLADAPAGESGDH